MVHADGVQHEVERGNVRGEYLAPTSDFSRNPKQLEAGYVMMDEATCVSFSVSFYSSMDSHIS
jgi:hypothetical protein